MYFSPLGGRFFAVWRSGRITEPKPSPFDLWIVITCTAVSADESLNVLPERKSMQLSIPRDSEASNSRQASTSRARFSRASRLSPTFSATAFAYCSAKSAKRSAAIFSSAFLRKSVAFTASANGVIFRYSAAAVSDGWAASFSVCRNAGTTALLRATVCSNSHDTSMSSPASAIFSRSFLTNASTVSFLRTRIAHVLPVFAGFAFLTISNTASHRASKSATLSLPK